MPSLTPALSLLFVFRFVPFRHLLRDDQYLSFWFDTSWKPEKETLGIGHTFNSYIQIRGRLGHEPQARLFRSKQLPVHYEIR